MVQLQTAIRLPEAATTGDVPLERLLNRRRSIREYRDASISVAQLGQLLWAAQGITNNDGLRTAPSAGALYPLELFVAAYKVETLEPFVYRYQPKHHRLTVFNTSNVNKLLARAAYGQSWLRDAAAVIVFTANYQKSTVKYHVRGARYTHIEVGHAAENLFLQAEALGLSTVVVGAFYDDEVMETLKLPNTLTPLLLMPVGYNRR